MNVRKILVGCSALALVTGVWAEEAEDAAAGDAAAETSGEATGKAAKPAAPAAFSTLPFCRRASGAAEVRLSDAAAWVPVEEGRFYPLGASYRTRGEGSLVVAFSKDSTVSISGDASFGTRPQLLGEKTRTVVVQSGTLDIALAHNLPDGAFNVVAPGFRVKNMAGDAKIDYAALGDGDEATVRCVTGTMAVSGRHFEIPQMRAANAFRIRTNHDNLVSVLYGLSGDYVTKIDRGLATRSEIGEDGLVKTVVEQGSLDWHLSPETRVQINRAVPSIGERMSVTVITFDAAGEPCNNFAFAEGRAEVNSGELIVAKKDGEDLAKRAAEAADETTTAAADEESGDAADGDSNNTNNNAKEKESDSSEEEF